jgi:hypothetical protein
MRAHFTICPKRPAGSPNGDCRTRSSKIKRGRPPGPRMKCGWGCGAQLTGRNMRAHFTICSKRLAASDGANRRGRSSKVKRGRPQGLRMKCGSGCGYQLTTSRSGRVSRHAGAAEVDYLRKPLAGGGMISESVAMEHEEAIWSLVWQGTTCPHRCRMVTASGRIWPLVTCQLPGCAVIRSESDRSR